MRRKKKVQKEHWEEVGRPLSTCGPFDKEALGEEIGHGNEKKRIYKDIKLQQRKQTKKVKIVKINEGTAGSSHSKKCAPPAI